MRERRSCGQRRLRSDPLPQAERGEEVVGPHALVPVQVGHRPRHPEDAKSPAGRERSGGVCPGEHVLGLGIQLGVMTQKPKLKLGVAGHACPPEPHTLPLSGLDHSLPRARRGTGWWGAQIGLRGTLDRHQQVHPVKQRAAQAPAVASQVSIAALAPVAHAGESTRTGIGGGQQDEPGWQDKRALAPDDRDEAVLKRLSERLKRWPGELRELIQKQHAVVSQGGLARPRWRASADEASG